MQGPGTPSHDQLRVFLTVVDTGSFAAAGRSLGRATSAISYAVANLEHQLGLTLFDRERTRKPVLTEAGHAVLTEAHSLSTGMDSLLAKVRALTDGLEAEMALVVDVLLPTEWLVEALQAFEAEFPTIVLRLHVEALGAVTQLVQNRVAHIGISGTRHAGLPGMERVQIGSVQLIPVAAPTHPLARAQNPAGIARKHVQLVLSDRSTLTQGQDFGVISMKTWRLADLGAKHALLLAGVGWGNMPAPMVAADIAAGRLKRLDLPEWQAGTYVFNAIYRTDTPPRPAAAWMIRRFQARGPAP
jgi:DNA-binding transcriptional LysR family regulator